ncbi:MAG: NAD(P)/FAD-dependent oxidoreductase [Actinoallomurus sp.]
MTGRTRFETDVAIVGAGPAGLAAALALRAAGVGRVTVVERERDAGGIPRHSHHIGYGLRDLRRFMSGPEYARQYVRRARAAGVALRTGTMVTGWSADGGLELTGPDGLRTMHASAVLLATGARERPRAARLVPGDRGQGVYTTGQLQQAVYEHGQPIGTRALVVGAEHVGFSAMVTLRHAGVTVLGLVTEAAHHESYAAFNLGARVIFRTPVLTRTRVVELRGRGQVAEVVLERDGVRKVVRCDTVVFTGDWIPDHELVRARGADLVPATRGPAVDATGATTVAGVFAAGNLCHPVETADIAALGGRHAGEAVARWLRRRDTDAPHAGVRVETDDAALAWVFPSRLRSTADLPPRGRLYLRSRITATMPRITVSQGDRALWHRRVPRLLAGRTATLDCASWLPRIDPDGPPVRITVV